MKSGHKANLMLTYGWLHFTDDTKATTSGKRSVTYQTATKAFSSLLSRKHGLLLRPFMASPSPFLYQFFQA
ncbi:hypothetical protein EYF80_019940 [Liparis tanakae]|uniref:Uncharacterized protein n=1 Tax=Liparis tanakae TaxID=230148 RepID=A0A4Z2HY62_9TELE|nr:hypothetical protein EYF80_019940 [Liparis tanakae]